MFVCLEIEHRDHTHELSTIRMPKQDVNKDYLVDKQRKREGM